MRGYHLLFINTGSGNTPHCQPNPLSLHLVPWQGGWGGVGSGGGGCRDQVQRPRCSANEDDRVFTPLQLWMYADEDRVGWGVMAYTKKKRPLFLLSHSFLYCAASYAFPAAFFLYLTNFLAHFFVIESSCQLVKLSFF